MKHQALLDIARAAARAGAGLDSDGGHCGLVHAATHVVTVTPARLAVIVVATTLNKYVYIVYYTTIARYKL